MLSTRLEEGGKIMPIFIFDGESAGTKICGYNRYVFINVI